MLLVLLNLIKQSIQAIINKTPTDSEEIFRIEFKIPGFKKNKKVINSAVK